MEKLSFKLEIFEGPLDLLLHLVVKHKLDINDIEISKLLEQYLLYLDQCAEHDLELAGEFLEMAARLIYIKTLALLPAPEEEEEEKKALQGALIEYALYCGGDMFVRKQAIIKAESDYQRVHEAAVLRDAFLGMHVKKIPVREQGPDERFKVIVKHKMFSVTTKVISILKQLYKTGTADMEGLYDGVTDRSERVATFLAVLELTKSGRIYISDDNTTITFIGKRKERKSS